MYLNERNKLNKHGSGGRRHENMQKSTVQKT